MSRLLVGTICAVALAAPYMAAAGSVSHEWNDRLRFSAPNGVELPSFGQLAGDALIIGISLPFYMEEGTHGGFAQVARGFARGVDAAVLASAGAVGSIVATNDAMPAAAVAAIEGVPLSHPAPRSSVQRSACDVARSIAEYTACLLLTTTLGF